MTTEIETTKRALYGCLDRIRRAGKHRKLTAEFEERLEEHLEALRLSRVQFTETRRDDLERRLAAMTEERDQIQQRLHAIDHAYNEQSKEFDHARSNMAELAIHVGNLETANRVSGEELIRVQGVARQYLDDCRSAEKHSDRFSKQLRDAQSVIGHQEQLILGQRLAIADMHMAGRAAKSAVATLQRLGYTDCGGQLWKPPLGKAPTFVDFGAGLRDELSKQPSR